MRSSFSTLQSVLMQLVQSAISILHSPQLITKHHLKKVRGFVEACLAFCFITIASITEPLQKIKYQIKSAERALWLNELAQGDAFLKAAIQSLSTVVCSSK